MLDYVLKVSVLPLSFWLGLWWINGVPQEHCETDKKQIKELKKAPEGCNPPEPWDPNFKNYETIEERQRVAETPIEIYTRSLKSIELILQREELQNLLNESSSEEKKEN